MSYMELDRKHFLPILWHPTDISCTQLYYRKQNHMDPLSCQFDAIDTARFDCFVYPALSKNLV